LAGIRGYVVCRTAPKTHFIFGKTKSQKKAKRQQQMTQQQANLFYFTRQLMRQTKAGKLQCYQLPACSKKVLPDAVTFKFLRISLLTLILNVLPTLSNQLSGENM